MKRPKLVDYSDSEGESTAPIGPTEPPGEQQPSGSPSKPRDENELAQIVIQLQHQYTKEVCDLERRQEESERQLVVWKAQIEDRLQLQVNVMASIIKASKQSHARAPSPPGRVGHRATLTGGRKSLA
ncbi:hypothetical protein LX36DRAFT_591047 [Colletotrichum falcatum]|nr:hypothetical protein LX36DRAFT_591047 [Colletotrichum falcatum]